MNALQTDISDFLNHKSLAVAGVSRNGDTAANIIYRKLRTSGYRVYAINPNAEMVEGDPCYPDLASLPDQIGGLVIGTRPEQALGLVNQCPDAGVKSVWFHRSIGTGSYDKIAADRAREIGLTVISTGCPMMFCQPVDIFHKCLRWYHFGSQK